MPEGDTIFRTARNLRPTLEGRTIDDARSRRPDLDLDPIRGQLVPSIETRGKHLLMHLENGHVIHSHMGMTGSWHTYAEGEKWQKPASRADLVLVVASRVCVCFTPKTLELLTPLAFRQHEHLRNLGPDLLREPFDMEEALRRFRASDHLPLGQVVMDQRVVCGIGNIYKSELLFLERMDPFGEVSRVDDERLRGLLERARRLMRRNCGDAPRQTRFGRGGSLLWVYSRQGEACFQCGGLIAMRHQGDLGRSTYWCPACQQLPG